MTNHSAYFLALGSAILFSGASVIFTRFARSHSVVWISTVKNSIAFVAFFLSSLLLHVGNQESWSSVSGSSAIYFLGSGFFGLAVGDYFLFQGFRRIGSARTLIVFSFAPLLLSLEGYVLFHQALTMTQFYALLFMMACVWTISYEGFKKSGHWEWRGIVFAILGVTLDNVGVVMSRKGLDLSPDTNAITANLIRSFAGMIPLLLAAAVMKEKVWARFRALTVKDKFTATAAAFCGTYMSLTLWITALKIGHIGSLAGVGSFNPVAASIWEWILGKKRPTVYLIAALILFFSGFALLLTH